MRYSGFVFSIRFPFAIFLFLIALLVCSLNWRRWLTVVGSASGVLFLSGVLDWLTLGYPFQPIWLVIVVFHIFPIGVRNGEFAVLPPDRCRF